MWLKVWQKFSQYIAGLEHHRIIRRFNNRFYQLESVQICLCGSTQFTRVAEEDRYGIPVGVHLCKNCGLGFQSPRPTHASLEKFYQADYRKLYRGTAKIDHEYFLRSYRRGGRVLEFLASQGLSLEGQAVVEVGCGPGGILKAFQERGNRVWGSELDAQCVAYSNSQRIPTYYGSVDVLIDAGVRADLIILSHLLEHIPSPIDFLNSLHKILNKDGIVYVEVPGVRNPDADFFAGLQIAHLYYFDLVSLQYVMRAAGFQMLAGDEVVRSVFQGATTKVDLQFDGNYAKNRATILGHETSASLGLLESDKRKR